MKFTQMLDVNQVPEWRNKYLDYRRLDNALNKAIENKNIKSREIGAGLYSELVRINQKIANYFKDECMSELKKINNFHLEKLTEMKGKYNNLQDQLDQVLSSALYREIQSTNKERRESISNTVSSISELIGNLKGKLSSQSDPNAASSAETSPRMPRTSKIKSISEGSSNLRQTIVNSSVCRKLSSGFANSHRRLTNNFGSISEQLASLRLRERGMSASSIGTNLTVPGQLPRRLGDEENNLPIVDAHVHQHHQALSGISHLPKKQIISDYRKKISYLKFAFRELYFNLVLLEHYIHINHGGFEQILRKHDRLFASTIGRKFYQDYVHNADFYNDLKTIDDLIENVEHVYTLHFENGNRRKAIEKLQVPTYIYKTYSPKLNFRIGYELGMLVVLLLLILVVGFFIDTGYLWHAVFRLYRGPLLLTIFLFQTGISIFIWKHYKINHVLIFELNPRNNLSFQHFLELASLMGIIWSISVLSFVFSERFNISSSYFPLVLIIIILSFMFNPTTTGHHQSRFWLIKILVSSRLKMTLRVTFALGQVSLTPIMSESVTKSMKSRIFTAPLHRVRFADFWIADQLVSIVPVFLDLEYLSCLYITGDILTTDELKTEVNDTSLCVTKTASDLIVRTIFAALPAWFRCAQCLRRWRDENWLRLHLANAGKYGCMVTTILLSSISQYTQEHVPDMSYMRTIWIVIAIFTSCLTAYWDIIYDFGLFNAPKEVDEEKEETQSSDELDDGPISRKDLWDIFNSTSDSKKKKIYPFLRKELVYPVWVYYFAIIENWILRFGWIITISLTEFSGIEPGLVVSLLAPLEMFRRFVWNCIRLENEQLNNCGLFRAVRDIPIEVLAPIDESHLDKVMIMMDSRDGPSMRNRLMKRRTLRPSRVSFMVLQTPSSFDPSTTLT